MQRQIKQLRPLIVATGALAALGACSGSGKTPIDGGNLDLGGNLRAFTPPVDPGAGGILFAVSGERLAFTGYPFPPVSADDAAFVDGWQVQFTRLLVTIDAIKLSANPDFMPGDQSKTGALLAEADGPWAVDLSHDDPSYLEGKGGAGEKAVPIAALSRQSDDQPFPTDGTRYAFGFDIAAATPAALNVNLDAAGVADYQQMIADGCAVLYVGTATFKGGTVAGHTDCNQGHESWPRTVDFRLCFSSPTTYLNCQNPDNTGAALPGEESQRGIAFVGSRSVIGQVTIHTDHPFWDSVLHDSPAHFDQFAARAVGVETDGGIPSVSLPATRGVDYAAYTDAAGTPLDWRYCMDPPTDVHPRLTGRMAFDPQSVPRAVGADPSTGLRDYDDFSTYDQSTQGHLNSDGLCALERHYPSPL